MLLGTKMQLETMQLEIGTEMGRDWMPSRTLDSATWLDHAMPEAPTGMPTPT